MKISEVYLHCIREMTRILSIDVGIKNLALCVFNISDGKCQVTEWKTVNLIQSPEVEQEKLCTCFLLAKNKKTPPKACGKKAKYTDPTGNFTYCDKHAKMSENLQLPTKQTTESWWKKQLVADVAAEYERVCVCASDTPQKRKKEEMLKEIAKYYAQRTFIPIQTKKSKNAKEVSLVDVGRAVKVALLEVADGIDCVIIENQISTIAARMKTIQGMIAQTFIMLDREAENKKPIEIEFVSSLNKLKGFNNDKEEDSGETQTQPQPQPQRAKYRTNKIDGVKICSEFIAKNGELAKWNDMFSHSKKKDDLADCFLQGVWFLKSRKYIEHADDLRINCVKLT